MNETTLQETAAARSPEIDARPGRELRVLAFVSKRLGLSPGQRFRIEQWAPYARKLGVDVDFVPFESPRLTEMLYEPGRRASKAAWVLWDFLRRAEHVARARRYDAAFVFREVSLLGPALYERVLARMKVPFIFDFDDAIWMTDAPPSKANGIFSKLHFHGKTSTICRLASAVTVGNEFLASYARDRSSNVFVLPTSIDLATYPVQPLLKEEDFFVVTWSGSVHTLYNLEAAREPLERLARRRRVRVRVICNRPPDRPIAHADNEFIPWQEAGEAEAIGATHVGIMPLQDEPFMHGKCGLKALQFMATGRPVVVSPVGMNKDLVQSGQNGFLAGSTDEWVDALERLATSAELRERLGLAGRATVEKTFAGSVVARKFVDVVRRVVG